MKFFKFPVIGMMIGMALVSAANIAGLVARYGLQENHDPLNPTAVYLCYFTVFLFGLAGFLAAVD
jgi:hypothetical protein